MITLNKQLNILNKYFNKVWQVLSELFQYATPANFTYSKIYAGSGSQQT